MFSVRAEKHQGVKHDCEKDTVTHESNSGEGDSVVHKDVPLNGRHLQQRNYKKVLIVLLSQKVITDLMSLKDLFLTSYVDDGELAPWTPSQGLLKLLWSDFAQGRSNQETTCVLNYQQHTFCRNISTESKSQQSSPLQKFTHIYVYIFDIMKNMFLQICFPFRFQHVLAQISHRLH